MLAPVLALFLAAPDFGEAERLLSEGRFAEARAAFEALLDDAEGGDRALLLDRIGSTRLAEGDVWGAEADFGASLDVRETFAARLHRGQALFFAGRDVADSPGALAAEVGALMNDAARELARAVEMGPETGPDRAEALVYLGLVERYRGAAEREEENHRRALEAEPGRGDAALYLAWCLETRGEAGGAEAVLETVPESARGGGHWLALGRLARTAGDDGRARDRFRRALLIAPFDVNAYLGLWSVSGRQKRFRDFENAVGEVLGRDPGCWLAHYYLGVCLREAGRPRQAIEALSEAWRLNADDADSRLLMADILHRDLSDEAASLPVYLEVMDRWPELARPREVLATVAMGAAGRKDFAVARKILYALRVAQPSEWAYATNLALVEREAGNVEEALRIYREAEEQYPLEPQIPNDRGLLLMGLGRQDEALAAFHLALERDGDCLEALENLGSYTLLGGDAAGAIPWFRRAYERARVTGGDVAKFRRYLDDASRAAER
ncbi:MAG: tetratricopeptide repeat protein [Planctomycetes bacterium]|nr:tetratricopeptide repeat protein [Planctomycetota bacterium]